ncbi:MAG: hypothetical protein MUF16_17990 [Burkholderiaceae bacterium]|nr:hypothetical protein [Burkholderiaceae bacterium]
MQRVRSAGFRQHAIHSDALQAQALAAESDRCKGNDGHTRAGAFDLEAPDLPRCAQAVEHRHLQIHQDEIHRLLAARDTASLPSTASSGGMPQSESIAAASIRWTGSSSNTRTRGPLTLKTPMTPPDRVMQGFHARASGVGPPCASEHSAAVFLRSCGWLKMAGGLRARAMAPRNARRVGGFAFMQRGCRIRVSCNDIDISFVWT